MSQLVTALLDGLPAGVWIQDDGTSSVPAPYVGNGSNGGQVGQIFLHEGANPGVSATAVHAFINNTTLGQSLMAEGRITTVAS